MITPVFEIAQDDEFVILTIRAPFAKAATSVTCRLYLKNLPIMKQCCAVPDTEITFDRKVLLFSSPPYFLRLFLPCELDEDNESQKGKYDVDSASFLIHAPKKNRGEFFPGLDMITRLLTPSGRQHVDVVLAEGDTEQKETPPADKEVADEEESEAEVEEEWCVDQKPATSTALDAMLATAESSDKLSYGFAESRKAIFSGLQDEISLVVDVKNPDDVPLEERIALMRQQEAEKFSDDHYIADLFASEEEIDGLIAAECWVDKLGSKLSQEERGRLKDLPKKPPRDLEAGLLKRTLYSLVDLLFAYAFDVRTTCGEHNVESSWTVCKLSSTMSWLVRWETLEEAVISSFRRALVFPLHRNYELCQAVLEDVKRILSGGWVTVLKCLLSVHELLNSGGEYRYILNELYVTEYCVWVQYASECVLKELEKELSELRVEKKDLDLDLDDLELAAKMAVIELEGKTHQGGELAEVKTAEEVLRMVGKAAALDSDDSDEEGDD